jgi:penicillin G amidase
MKIPYYGVPQNFIFAHRNGDIGYFLGATLPIRNSSALYLGCRVLDGTNTNNDWIGTLPNTDLPHVVNPKKGYIVTANNR